jgi:hypothetical protein
MVKISPNELSLLFMRQFYLGVELHLSKGLTYFRRAGS